MSVGMVSWHFCTRRSANRKNEVTQMNEARHQLLYDACPVKFPVDVPGSDCRTTSRDAALVSGIRLECAPGDRLKDKAINDFQALWSSPLWRYPALRSRRIISTGVPS